MRRWRYLGRLTTPQVGGHVYVDEGDSLGDREIWGQVVEREGNRITVDDGGNNSLTVDLTGVMWWENIEEVSDK